MFRRSGSIACFFVEGKLPSPEQPSFSEALAQHRFRTIENAASEEVSIGWVTPSDPTGDTFAVEDMSHGSGYWLRMRIDKKSLPAKWVAIYRSAAERSTGRALSVREKRELKQDLMSKLLPRVLPSVNFVEALYFPKRRVILLFATSRNLQESFAKLVRDTFDTHLEVASPLRMAHETKLAREQREYLERVSPVRWPHSNGSNGRPEAARPRAPVEEAAATAANGDEA